ncbi:MAG: class I SAM-dependent methyltransferase [Candidatus Pacearchaeota archaeon]|nr:MAG: class I SAM-dependent methyltransferase [Candidatus Pacearchaeota archaeon]
MRPDWDKVYKKGPHWERKHSKAIEDFVRYLEKRDKVLDLGCGSGRDVVFLARNGFDVYGIDISKEAIKKARNKIKEKGLKAYFDVGDLTALKFENNFFDAIYSNAVLNFTLLQESCSEIYRILKKDGLAYLIFLLDYIPLFNDGKNKEDHSFYPEDLILQTYKNSKFNIIYSKKFLSLDLGGEKPHKHNILNLLLKK